MRRTPHHILVCTSVHLRGSNRTSPPPSESQHGASETGAAEARLELLSSAQSAHARSPDWLAAWPSAPDEDALDELSEALRPLSRSLA
jgi:hypothetical protein